MILPLKQATKILVNHIEEHNQPAGFMSKTCKKQLLRYEFYGDLYINIYNWWQFFGDDDPDTVTVLVKFCGLGIMDERDAERAYDLMPGMGLALTLQAIDVLYDRQQMLNNDSDMLDILDI